MLVCLHFKQDSFIQFCRERHQFCKNSVILFLCILLSQHYTWHYRHILATLHTLTSAILFSLPLPPVRPENNRKKQITLFWRPPFVNQEGYQFLFSDYILPQDRLCILAASIPCHAKNEEQMRSFIFFAFICILDTHISIQYCYCRKNCWCVLTICFLILIFSKDARCKIC